MPKKILIFSLAYYPKHIGGAEVAIKEISDRLPADKYEFHLVCNRYDSTLGEEETIGNVCVHRIGITKENPSMSDLRQFPLHLAKLTYQWQAFWKAKQLHKEHQFDGIWAMMAHSCGVPAAKFKHASPDVPFVLTLQEGDPPEHIERKMRPFKKWFDRAFTSADRIQVISNFLGQWAKDKGSQAEPVLIPNAVNTAHFTQSYGDAELAAVREEYKVSDSDVLLVTTSRLVPKNGIDTVVQALIELPENIKFIVFGTGPEEDHLHRLIEQYALGDRVQLRGHIDHGDMPRYLKACDIFIRPSRSEGMGNSFLEAMAAELPVIATQVGGIADFLYDATRNTDKPATGWAVDPDSPLDIAEAVRTIMSDSQTTQKTVQHAKDMVLTQYDWDLIASKMEQEIFATL